MYGPGITFFGRNRLQSNIIRFHTMYLVHGEAECESHILGTHQTFVTLSGLDFVELTSQEESFMRSSHNSMRELFIPSFPGSFEIKGIIQIEPISYSVPSNRERK